MRHRLAVYRFTVIAALTLSFLSTAGAEAARADAITDWNEITVGVTNVPPGRPGPTNLLDIAAVHLAMYDAVQSIERDYRPYSCSIAGASGSSSAAAATAAYYVLSNRFPAQAATLDTTYQNYLTAHGISVLDAGIPVGASAAACLIAERADDGSFPVGYPPFFGGTDIGMWRPTTAGTSMAAPWLAYVRPFTIDEPSQFRPGPPPSLNSQEYTRAFNEVKSVGSLNSPTRTAEQTEMANFWNLNYQAVLNQTLRALSIQHVGNISDSSKLFAMTSSSMADAMITAWDSKRTFVFWRPMTAIQFGDSDGNPRTDGDPTWTPMIANPPYPDYTSGANVAVASATRAAQLFFGSDRMSIEVRTTNTVPTVFDTRTYSKFSDIRDEVVEARIYEGIHFRFADELARKQGEHIAQWTHSHYFHKAN